MNLYFHMSYLDEFVLKTFLDNINKIYYETPDIPKYSKEYGKIETFNLYDNIFKDNKFIECKPKLSDYLLDNGNYFIHFINHIKSCKFYRSFNIPLGNNFLYDEGTHIMCIGIDECGNLYEIICINNKTEIKNFTGDKKSKRKLPDIIINLIKTLNYDIKEDFDFRTILGAYRGFLKYYPHKYRCNNSCESSIVIKLNDLFIKIQELEEDYYKQHASIKQLYSSKIADYSEDSLIIKELEKTNWQQVQKFEHERRLLNKEISKLKNELTTSCQIYKTEIEELNANIAKLTENNQNLTRNLQVISTELEKSNTNLFDLRNKIRSPENTNELDKANLALSQFKNKVEMLYNENSRLKDENAQFVRNLDELILERCEKREEALKREIAQLTEKIRTRDALIVNLTIQNSDPPPYSA